MLHHFEPSLRIIFGALQQVRGPAKRLLDCSVWKKLLRLLDLCQADLSTRDAALCFVWSRMSVPDPCSVVGKARARCITFEGFCEALCRVACLKALPTDAELEASGCENAGSYLSEMQASRPLEYGSFLETRRTAFGHSPAHQPASRCLHHLLSLVMYTIEASAAKAGGHNLDVSEAEMRRFLHKP